MAYICGERVKYTAKCGVDSLFRRCCRVLCGRTGGTSNWSTYSRSNWSPVHVYWRPIVAVRRTSRESSIFRTRRLSRNTSFWWLSSEWKRARRPAAVVPFTCGVLSSRHKVFHCSLHVSLTSKMFVKSSLQRCVFGPDHAEDWLYTGPILGFHMGGHQGIRGPSVVSTKHQANIGRLKLVYRALEFHGFTDGDIGKAN